jgi:signal transduction histidine kinase
LLREGLALSRAGRIVWASLLMADLTGRRSPDELCGEAIEGVLEDVGHGLPIPGDPDGVECRVRGLRGEERRVRAVRAPWSEAGTAPAPDQHGQLELWLLHDLSHRRILEREVLAVSRDLHRANRELAELRGRAQREARERENLLTVVSHELRTPVTVIAGYNRMLLSGEVGPLNLDQQHFLEESSKSCQRLDGFIDRLMQASRENVRGEVLELSCHDLGALIGDTVEFLRPLFDTRSLGVETKLAPETRWARCDPARLEQVLTNLLTNALKYAHEGGEVEIESAVDEVAGRPMARITVSDDGPGVAVEERERIFEPYVRANEESEAAGLGLGLAIARRIVEAHGGCMAVDDRPGGGSRFHFTVPLAAGAPDAEPERKRTEDV